MARRPNAEPIYEAADRYRRTCFTNGHSLLWPDQEAWTPTTLTQLWEAILGRPDEGPRSFEDKLRDQLVGLSDDANRVAADAIGFYSLFSTMVRAEKKQKNLAEIISWRFKEEPPNLEVLLQAFKAGGIGSAGLHYNITVPWQFAYILKFAEFALLSHADLADSAVCRAIADRALAEVPKATEARHILLHLLFPDEFERIASRAHKQRITEAFARLAAGAQDTDTALANIRSALAAEYGRADIDFYDREIEARWRTSGGEDGITESLEAILAGYVEARKSEPFGSDSKMYQLLRGVETLLAKCDPVRERPALRVKASPGQGNWAAVPWISFLDSRETTTTQKGVYCVYLFREDMSGVYLTFNQGVTDPTKKEGWVAAEQSLRATARQLREAFPDLGKHGFALTDDIDLRTRGNLGESYEVSTVAHKFYAAGMLPSDEELLSDLDRVLGAYGNYVEGKRGTGSGNNAWIFQASSTYFDLPKALAKLKEMTWLAKQHSHLIRAGDRVFMWQAGKEAGVVGLATVLTDPKPMEQLAEEKQFNIAEDKFAGLQPRVRIRIDRVLPERLDRALLRGHPVLGTLTVLAGPQGTNFQVTKPQAEALLALMSDRRPRGPERRDLRAVVDEFAAALRQSHVSFGSRHNEMVRSFVASMATKRFAILTGLSGSGKTQLALRFGEWLGLDRSLVVPVRPDWTGAEALFGYEDALKEAVDGRRAWQVPAPLEFMLRAAGDPDQPYLLVLDEMNLAHVERYFADVLSGMESEYPCLPNLRQEGDGLWRVPASAETSLAVPRNLMVLGTVNVDETTYMFSPKVLDRANTFEFRVQTGDLDLGHQKPTPVESGQRDLVAGFLAIAADAGWHLDHPAPGQDVFAQHLRTIHKVLSEGGFEFGHRVFYEAVRFAAMYAAAGDDDPIRALDLQVMQKVLPRLHGSRRRLEATLCAIGQFCHDLTYDSQLGLRDAIARFDPSQAVPAASRLPISFEKVARMTRTVRANQFVSFTE
jgi:hypothetical protein